MVLVIYPDGIITLGKVTLCKCPELSPADVSAVTVNKLCKFKSGILGLKSDPDEFKLFKNQKSKFKYKLDTSYSIK